MSAKLEHATIRVNDLEASRDFFQSVMGLTEVANSRNKIYLGCGLNANYDLALVPGGTGLEHFALRVNDEAELERYAARLKAHGVPFENRDDTEPGEALAVRFSLPCGIVMELVVVEDQRYANPANPALARSAATPLDADHIFILTDDVEKEARFLRDVLGFFWSDVSRDQEGAWVRAWLRMENHHHDVGIGQLSKRDETLGHFAWTMANFEHIKMTSDALAAGGLRLEMGPGRHPVGGNLFAYFWEPGGNRLELSAEMAMLSPATPTGYWNVKDTLDAWGGLAPPRSRGGS